MQMAQFILCDSGGELELGKKKNSQFCSLDSYYFPLFEVQFYQKLN